TFGRAKVTKPWRFGNGGHESAGIHWRFWLPSMQNCMGKRSSALDFCASRCNLLQCGSDTAALLGRFLPRLGPLSGAALFFSTSAFRFLFTSPWGEAARHSASNTRLDPLGARRPSRSRGGCKGGHFTPPPPGRAAAPPAGSRRGGAPASPGRPPGGRNCASARSGAHPCKAHG